MDQRLETDDLRYADISDLNLFNVDLSGKKMYGAKVSLRCEQWDGLKLDETQMAMLLLMISQVTMPSKAWSDGLRALVESEIGEYQLGVLDRYLKLA